jgi:PAS domain S-box-containing protein
MDHPNGLQPQDFGIGRLFWRIREGVVVGDVDTGLIVLWNPAAEAMFGYTADEAIGQPIEIIIPEELRARHRAGLARFRETWQSELMDSDVGVELPGVHKSGQTLTIELLLSPIDETPIDGRFVLAVVRDVTARRRAEEHRLELVREQSARAAAEAAQQRFALLAETSRVLATSLVWETTLANVARLMVTQLADWCIVDIVDDDGQLQPVELAAASSSLEPMLREMVAKSRQSPGWEHHPTALAVRTGQTQLLTEIPDTMWPNIPDDEDQALVRQYPPQSAIAVPLTSRGRTLGTITLLTCSGRPPYTPSDVPLVEELGLRAAAAIENAILFQQARDAIAVRENFITVAAHELKTPVTSLRGYTQLLLRRIEAGRQLDLEAVRGPLAQIDRQAGRLTRLVSQLLDVSRLRAGKLRLEPRPTDLARLLRDASTAVQALTTRHEIVVRCSADLWAEVDPLRLEQVVVNLLDNAIKYSPEGGPIDLQLSLSAAGAVELVISDRGPGIPPEHRDRVFNRFYQVHSPDQVSGMGLGLYVSREIVDMHRGQITAEDRPGGGARFVITIPCKTVPAGTPASRQT